MPWGGLLAFFPWISTKALLLLGRGNIQFQESFNFQTLLHMGIIWGERLKIQITELHLGFCKFELHFDTLLLTVSVQFIHSVMCYSLWPHGWQHTRLPCPSPTLGACSNSCPSSRWCHPSISSSVIPFSCLQSCPASGSFPVSQFFVSGGQSIGTLASVLPMNIQDWLPLGLTSLISLQSKELSRVFSNTTVQKHQFFGPQLSFWSNSHIHTWLLEKP